MSASKNINSEKTKLPALLLMTDLSVTWIGPANGNYFTLEELQVYVGGRIEILHLDREGLEHRLLVVHEEGKLISLPLNILATVEWMKYYGETDFVSGDAIICHPDLIR